MICSLTTTEDRIKEAAREVFLEKGFDGTTTRDIARAAGINGALMNYYFRSKEKLFQAIFNDLAKIMFEGLLDLISRPITFREKIIMMLDHQFRIMMENPSLTIFIMNELHRNPERIINQQGSLKEMIEISFQREIDREVVAGAIQLISAKHLMTLIVANTQFMFVCKPMTMLTQVLTEESFGDFAEKQLEYVKEMICNFLFVPQKSI